MEFAAIIMGGVKAVGSLVAGAEESANLRAVEQSSRQSALYARQDAHNELRIATADAEAQRRRGRYAVGEQAAAFAQSGFSLTDSAAQAVEQSATEAELDALTIQYKGTLRNRAGQIEAQNYDTQADAARRSRKLVPLKTAIGVATNLLSGYAGKTGGKIT